MENSIHFIDQINLYFEKAPLWPFALLGVVIIFAIGVEILNRQRRADAVDYYDSTFKTELIGLYPHPTHWPQDLSSHLRTRLPLMREAFENLKGFIPQNQLREYNIAWNKFYDFCRLDGMIDSNQTETATSAEAQHEKIQIFQQLVNDLLAYTDQFKR